MSKKYKSESLAKDLEPTFQKHQLQLVYFFGSAFQGKIGPLSDIDLATLWPKEVNAPMLKSLELQSNIQKILDEDRFEIGCLNNQNLSFCYEVIKSGICIYGKEEDRVAYETDILNRYLDFSYLGDEYNRIFDQKILKKE